MHPFKAYVNPHLGQLLEQLRLDKSFVRGDGCWLWDDQGERYLDFVAAYGALPFGFNPPEIWAALQAVRDSGEPSFVQPSALNPAGELAARLIELAPPGMRYVTFANSGAEAVEAAIKLARAATGRRRVLSAENSFHGKTLGALSATNRTGYQHAFFAPVEGFDKVPYGDAVAVAAAFAARPGEYAAVLLEPIQGEGGIVVPPPGYLTAVQRLCREHGALLMVDEIQTGLGRTGHLFASTQEGITPDVITLAKALGGGLVPIGAVLCTEAAFTEEFAMKHSSTFAGNTLACRAGLATLDRLTRDGHALVRHVAETGAYLRQGLERLAAQYPQVIRAVRGRGFMLGVEFGVSREDFRGTMLGVMAEQELLTPVIAAYLLNVEKLRVAPTLNGNAVLRMEPPLIATREHCDYALAAMGRAVAAVAAGNTAELLRHLLGVERRTLPAPLRVAGAQHLSTGGEPAPQPGDDPAEGRFAFLVHPVNLSNYPEFDGSFALFTRDELAELTARWNNLLEPFVIGTTRVRSASGQTAYGEFIAIPRTADELLAMPHREAVALVAKSVAMARERGARIVGLGAYTSVVTRAGLHLKDPGVAITTGNSYTVVAAVEAVAAAARRLGLGLERSTAAVVGASGSIGRAVAILLAGDVARLVLVGNPDRPDQSRRRLLRVVADICRHLAGLPAHTPGTLGARLAAFGGWPTAGDPPEAFIGRFQQWEASGDCPLRITVDLDALLPAADVVVSATSSTGELVTPGNLKHGALVCDLSRPPNVSRAVRDARPDVLAIDGGVVAVPGLPSLGWNFGFEPGLAYACMAETMMLALEHHYTDTSLGTDLNLETILWMRDLARRHGFQVAQLRSFDRPLAEAEWQRLLAARAAVLGYPAG